MAEPTIICPKCHNEIKLTESLVAPQGIEIKRSQKLMNRNEEQTNKVIQNETKRS